MLRRMTDAFALAMADLAKLRAREAKLEAELAAIRAEREKLTVFVEVGKRYSPDFPTITSASAVRPGTKSAALVDAAIAAIERAARPLLIAELVNATRDAGLVIGGKNDSGNLAGYLSRDPRVSFHRNVGWWLSNRPIPQRDGAVRTSLLQDDLTAPPAQTREAGSGGGT